MKAATECISIQPIGVTFQSTPPVKAATFNPLNDVDYTEISIHAAREGGDVIAVYRHMALIIFQSTPPVKAATR